jgi:ADP-ribose pyrophosphatase YjhB (NUDIX family)
VFDYYHDSAAPQANSLVAGASAVVADSDGRILLQRRSDSGNWALPGGVMDIGETLAGCAIREVREETGFDVRIERIVGIYSDPGHVFAYDDGEVRQEFSICLACTIAGGSLGSTSARASLARVCIPRDARADRARPHPRRLPLAAGKTFWIPPDLLLPTRGLATPTNDLG